MKGIVFNLLEEAVVDEYGDDTWDALLDSAGLGGIYTSLGSYPDEDLLRLVGAASKALDREADDIVRWLGRSALPRFAKLYPEYFEGHTSTRPFLMTLNSIIHPEVRKLYPGADVPEFDFDNEPAKLVIGYQSKRKMCAFAEGLIEGAAGHFGDSIATEQPQCMVRGDDKCVIEVTFLQ